MNRSLSVLFATLLCISVQADETLPPAPRQLPVLAWGGIGGKNATPERYREFTDAGFTINFTWFGDVHDALKGLDTAKAAGVKLLINSPQLQKDPAHFVAGIKSHPAVAGYFLQDEPPSTDFPKLAAWARRIYAVDPNHFCYINLLPTYAIPDQMKVPTYAEYLKKYMATVPVRVLSFDHYPVIQEPNKNPYLRGDWYDNLEQISAASRKAGVPFWAFSLSTRCLSYAGPTLANVRCQIFSDLAYGAQGLEYFTYYQITGSSEGQFTEAPLNADGTRTKTYDIVKQVNSEAHALWPVFCGAKILDVSHAGPAIPSGTHRYQPKPPFTSIDSKGPTIVTQLQNGDHNFLAIVNCDVNDPTNITIARQPDAKIQLVTKESRLIDAGQGDFHIVLSPGDMTIFAWPK